MLMKRRRLSGLSDLSGLSRCSGLSCLTKHTRQTRATMLVCASQVPTRRGRTGEKGDFFSILLGSHKHDRGKQDG
jgi:hypothetical protein